MKKNKITVIALAIAVLLIAALPLTVAGCAEKGDSLDLTLALSELSDTLVVEITGGGEVVYSYDAATGEVYDKYNADIDISSIVSDTRGSAYKLTRNDINSKYDFTFDDGSGLAELTATLKSPSSLLGVDVTEATVSISGNVFAGVLDTYTLSYTHGNYEVLITLS